jgi:hypothetical protein
MIIGALGTGAVFGDDLLFQLREPFAIRDAGDVQVARKLDVAAQRQGRPAATPRRDLSIRDQMVLPNPIEKRSILTPNSLATLK